MRSGVLVAAAVALLACARQSAPSSRGGAVPRLWDDAALRGWALPVAGLGAAPTYPSEAEYYAAPVDDLRTYPVYHPSREPPGYREWLRKQGARPLIGPELPSTEAGWIEAGRSVFEQLDTPSSRTADPKAIAHFSDAAAFDKHRDAAHDVVSRDGVVLDYRWVVARDGTLQLGVSSCAGCHSRLMEDGTVLPGAPSNFDLSGSPAAAVMLGQITQDARRNGGEGFYSEFGVPWRADDPHAPFRSRSKEEIDRFLSLETGEPPGTVFPRFNGSPLFMTRMADLRGVRRQRYLDATGTHLNRGPEDIARYGILVEYADNGVFGPHHMRPAAQERVAVRPPDAAMFALALYLYSLEPAPSPFPLDERALRGQAVFEQKKCGGCHAPPDYSNHKLVAVEGFDPPGDDPRLEVMKSRVGTDPSLALRTRKGTGYYRIPSLRGLWYRGLFEHSGSVASLEDWFDPRRLRDDYVPTGFRGPGVAKRAVPGHTFGLDLPPADKAALIAFLKTL